MTTVGVRGWHLVDNTIACKDCERNLRLAQKRTIVKVEEYLKRCGYCGRILGRIA